MQSCFCIHCRLPQSHCACITAPEHFEHVEPVTPPTKPVLEWALLQHEQEYRRETATGQLALNFLHQSHPQGTKVGRHYAWQRQTSPSVLIQKLKSPEYQPWLLFPADRDSTAERVQHLLATKEIAGNEDNQAQIDSHWRVLSDDGKKIPLVIVPDGTWKEVRKIVRKSPWLEHVPLLTLEPTETTRYTLRRNPDAQHLCTLEVMAWVYQQLGEAERAQTLMQGLERFQSHFNAYKSGHALKKR